MTSAMRATDRRHYVPAAGTSDPYADCPQMTFCNQTISAPHIHAICLELLREHLQPVRGWSVRPS